VPSASDRRLKHYFLTYKEPPSSTEHRTEITHVYGREEAYDVIRRSQEDYTAQFGISKHARHCPAEVRPGVGSKRSAT